MYISYQSFVFGSFDRRFGKYTIIILTGKDLSGPQRVQPLRPDQAASAGISRDVNDKMLSIQILPAESPQLLYDNLIQLFSVKIEAFQAHNGNISLPGQLGCFPLSQNSSKALPLPILF